MNQYNFGQVREPFGEGVEVEIISSEPIEKVEPITKSEPVQAPKSTKYPEKQYRVCSINQLKIYKHPTKESDIIGGLNHGTVITSLDLRNGWLKIIFHNSTGWIPKNRTVEV